MPRRGEMGSVLAAMCCRGEVVSGVAAPGGLLGLLFKCLRHAVPEALPGAVHSLSYRQRFFSLFCFCFVSQGRQVSCRSQGNDLDSNF